MLVAVLLRSRGRLFLPSIDMCQVVTDNEVEIRYVIPTHARGETNHFCHLRLDYLAANSLNIGLLCSASRSS